MKLLSKGGVTFQVLTLADEARLKQAGYVEVTPVEEKVAGTNPAKVGAPHVSPEMIAELCLNAGVSVEDLKFESDNPTLAEVRRAIKAAKTAKE